MANPDGTVEKEKKEKKDPVRRKKYFFQLHERRADVRMRVFCETCRCIIEASPCQSVLGVLLLFCAIIESLYKGLKNIKRRR